MTIFQRLSVFLFWLDFPCAIVATGMLWNRYVISYEYPLATVMLQQYDYTVVIFAFFAAVFILPMLCVGYLLNKPKVSKCLFLVSAALFLFACFGVASELMLAARAEQYYNPETVQSTMVEIDLQQLENLQDSTEGTMIYFGRPSCAQCNEIKPDLDILVNNSHSLVYYYNTEQDREDNHDAMQAVLDTYNVGTVPALAVFDNTGNTQEVYYDEEIIDYFLDTSKFNY